MKRNLQVASGAWLALFILGAVVAIAQKLPMNHPWFGVGNADSMFQDWLSSGTALSGPAPMLAVAAVAVFLLFRPRPAYTVGVVVATFLGLLTPISVLGETITWEAVASDTFNFLWAFQAWGILIAGMLMWAFGIAELLAPRAEGRQGVNESAFVRSQS